MKIILNQDIHNLGEEGDIANVARGYARNFLLPKGFAVLHTKQNIAAFEHKRDAIEKRKAEKREAAQTLKERLQGIVLELKMSSGQNGRLFGSVTNSMVMDELTKLGIPIEKKRIEIPSHTIKVSGSYTLKIKLYGSESAQIKLWINKEEVEARELATAEMKARGLKAEAVAEEAVTDDPAEVAAEETSVEEPAEAAAKETAAEEKAVEETAVEEPENTQKEEVAEKVAPDTADAK